MTPWRSLQDPDPPDCSFQDPDQPGR